MKELRRKIIQDDYTYNGEKVKSWRVIFDYRERNERKTLKPRFKKKADAERELTRLNKQHTEAKGRFVADKDQVRLCDYAEIHRKYVEENLSPTSQVNELSRIDEAVNFFGGQTIASIIRADIKHYKAHLEKKIAVNAKKVEITVDGQKKMVAPPLSGESVRKYLTRLRKMLNEARRDYGNLPEFDFSGDMMPRKKKPRSLTIDFFELDRLLEACTGKQAKMKLLAIALHETGGRLSEIVGNEKRLSHLPGVKRKDVDLENQRIELWNSKLSNDKDPESRTAYLSEFFRDALIDAGIENLEPDDLIFKRGDFRKSWEKILEVAGIDANFWERDFRHCFASNCAAAGVPRAAIKHQINHAGDDLLETVYTNVRESDLTELFARYEDYCREQRAKVEAEKTKQKTMEAAA